MVSHLVASAVTLDGIPLDAVGPTALAGAAVLLVLTGRLIPRSTHRAIVAQIEKERDHWQQAAQERSAQVSTLLDATETSTRLIEAVTQVTGTAPREAPR